MSDYWKRKPERPSRERQARPENEYRGLISGAVAVWLVGLNLEKENE